MVRRIFEKKCSRVIFAPYQVRIRLAIAQITEVTALAIAPALGLSISSITSSFTCPSALSTHVAARKVKNSKQYSEISGTPDTG